MKACATRPQNYKFEGKERDSETGNDDFGARYYNYRFGRWLSADWSAKPVAVPYATLANPQTLNLYSMVSDDPETSEDLDGHCGRGDYDDVSCDSLNGTVFEGHGGQVMASLAAATVGAAGSELSSLGQAVGRAAIAYFLTPQGQQNVVAIAQAVGDYYTGSISPFSTAAVGEAREAAVAAYEGGTVSRMLVKGASTSTDVDVIGKAGEYIGVGGPAKGNDLSKFGQKLSALRDAAAGANVKAKYYLEAGTSQKAIDLAKKILGKENVTVFKIAPKKKWFGLF